MRRTKEARTIKFKIFWAWFDFWVGFYYDRRKDILYVCPLPTVVLAFSFRDIEIPTAEYDGTQEKASIASQQLRKTSVLRSESAEHPDTGEADTTASPLKAEAEKGEKEK